MKFVPALLCLLYLILTVLTRDFVFDLQKSHWRYDTYIDQIDGGNSAVVQQITPNQVAFRYRVGTTIEYPYVGAGYSSPDTTKFIDISMYKSVIYEIDTGCISMNIGLNQFIYGFSKLEDGRTQDQPMTELIVKPGISRYEIPLKSFVTQQWWFVMNNVTHADVPPTTFKTLCGINFANHPSTPHGSKGKIAIKKITFRKDISLQVAFSLILTILWYTGSLLLHRLKRKPEEPTFVAYEKSEIGDSPRAKLVSEVERLKAFLAVEYKNQKLSLEFAEQTLEIPQHRIRQLLKEITTRGFKEYVTELRMTEAKRLLTSDSHKVQDVASAVGYTHTSTFNHNFKEFTGLTPREFREQQEKQ